jgi:hypothetical protein
MSEKSLKKANYRDQRACKNCNNGDGGEWLEGPWTCTLHKEYISPSGICDNYKICIVRHTKPRKHVIKKED